MLILSGPAGAVNAVLTTSNVDIENDILVPFQLDVEIDDPTLFIPLTSTVLTFNSGSNSYSCTIDSSNVVSGCDFLSVVSREISGF